MVERQTKIASGLNREKFAFAVRTACAAGLGWGLLALMPASANTTITFDGLGSTFGGGSPYTESGLTFTSPYGFVGPIGVANNFAAAYGAPSTVTVTPEAGSGVTAFDVESEQFSFFNSAISDQYVTFTGTKADGSSVAETFDIPGYNVGIHTVSLTGFTDLVSLKERVGFSTFKNLVVTEINGLAVPEPATWTLMLLGVGAIGGVARNRRGSRFSGLQA